MNLTMHFTLEELCASSTGTRLGIDNTPSEEVAEHLAILAQGLEQVRTLLGFPMHIDSGYRCSELNTAVGGAAHSAHMDGWAADFVCMGFGSPLAIVRAIVASPIQFDQCIQEGHWVHISFAPALRRRVLTAHFGPNGTTYTEGIA